jgi:hypothetical protein
MGRVDSPRKGSINNQAKHEANITRRQRNMLSEWLTSEIGGSFPHPNVDC